MRTAGILRQSVASLLELLEFLLWLLLLLLPLLVLIQDLLKPISWEVRLTTLQVNSWLPDFAR
jgi:hypothetical protein